MQTFRVLSCGLGFAENAGHATSSGFELEFEWSPDPQQQYALGFANAWSRLAEDVPNLGAADGERIPGIPRWTATALAYREMTLSSSLVGSAQVAFEYASEFWNDYGQATRVRIPSHGLIDLRLGLRGRRWSIELYADNALNDRAVSVHAKNIVGEWQVTAPPRTVGVRISTAL